MKKRWLDRPGAAWLFGVIVPIAMVVFDPAVFRNNILGLDGPILGRFKAFGYVGIALGVCVMAAVLVRSKPRALVTGMLAGGSLFSMAVGLAILPMSFLGVFFLGIGLLGFTPFVSAVVFARRSRRLFAEAPPDGRRGLAALGLVLFLTIPAGVQLTVSYLSNSAKSNLVSARPDAAEEAVRRLRPVRLLVNGDDLVRLWVEHMDPKVRENLATAYQRLFGEDITLRASAVVD